MAGTRGNSANLNAPYIIFIIALSVIAKKVVIFISQYNSPFIKHLYSYPSFHFLCATHFSTTP
jgi:hypothetical protein